MDEKSLRALLDALPDEDVKIEVQITEQDGEYRISSDRFPGLSVWEETPEKGMLKFVTILKMHMEVMIEDGEKL